MELMVVMNMMLQASGPVCYSDNHNLLYHNMQDIMTFMQDPRIQIAQDSLNICHTTKLLVKPTFKMMALEWLGGAAGGVVAGGTMYRLTVPLTENAHSDGPYAVCFALSLTSAFFGIAGGTTLVGNAITEPNGSFGKACLGELAYSTISAAFVGVGCGLLAAIGPADFSESGFPVGAVVVACIIGAGIIVPPPLGAVIGYNSNKIGCCCITGSRVSHNESELSNLSFKIRLFEVNY